MKPVKCLTWCWLLAVWMIATGGCGDKKADENEPTNEVQAPESAPTSELEADESKPVSEVKAEAETMDTGQLRDMAVVYKQAIVAKKSELEEIAARLKEIPVTELLGEKAKQLQTNIDNLTQSIDALKERFEVYYAQLKEKSGDISGLEI